jgi:hypothetical protein
MFAFVVLATHVNTNAPVGTQIAGLIIVLVIVAIYYLAKGGKSK